MKQKSLSEMTPIEMAELLHELFPEEIGRFIGYVEATTIAVRDNPVRSHWTPRRMTEKGWSQLATEIQEKIYKHRKQLHSDSKFFATELFTGYSSMFLMACLQDYLSICPDFRFKRTIEAFFEV